MMDYRQEELFDAYLDGTLSDREKADFEAALTADKTLRYEFDLHAQTRELVEIAALKAALSSIQQSVAAAAPADDSPALAAGRERKRNTKPFYGSRVWQAAAAVVLLAAGIATWRTMSASATDKLYAKYYAPDAGLPGLMGGSTVYALDDAMVDYKSGQYRDAAEKLERLRQHGDAGDTVGYYLGMALLADEQYEAALKSLRPLAQKENVFRKKAVWYEALAFLKSGKKDAAQKELNAIAADTSNPKAAAARQLLAEWQE